MKWEFESGGLSRIYPCDLPQFSLMVICFAWHKIKLREALPSLSLFIENLYRITDIHISHRFLRRYASFMVSHEIPAHCRGVSEILKFYPPTPLQKINENSSYFSEYLLVPRALAASAPILQFSGMTPCEVKLKTSFFKKLKSRN